ncbi:uroporphyrinogen-III synthase [Peribacillus asahii]|uniref:Uroporphyrinogen-III synthase n=1 Tax=Peribacillus asahii TaxID=228899 RepID=A0A3Q9RQX5_9BACI|nr:uroporphyrinogen-III synthase [Peribacillus asahii]AZV44607.1 hypothetical protein BAOM_3998 [Peribacillus asahii]USK84276.1 uroporphyrinogen-III synthase [Peribacillus asahii]
MTKLPLHDYRILITRGQGQVAHFKAMIEQYGGTPITVPLLDFRLPDSHEAIKATLSHLSDYDWLVLTSQNGVRFFFELAGEYAKSQSLPKIAVIGTKTAEALQHYGYHADFIPNEFVAEGFVAEFIPQLSPRSRVLVAKGNLARTIISGAIEEIGAACDELDVYETVLPEASKQKLVEVITTEEVEVITFTSSSTVHHFMQIVAQYELHRYLESLIIACIGPIAKKTALHYGLEVDICPNVYTTEAMIQDLVAYTKAKGGKSK